MPIGRAAAGRPLGCCANQGKATISVHIRTATCPAHAAHLALGATRGGIAGLQADAVPIPPRCPRSRRTQTLEMPKPTGRVGHEHPAVPGNVCLANPASPTSVPVSQDLFLAVGMLVPAPDRHGLGQTKEHPSYVQ